MDDIRRQKILTEPVAREISFAGHENDPFPGQPKPLEKSQHLVDLAKDDIA